MEMEMEEVKEEVKGEEIGAVEIDVVEGEPLKYVFVERAGKELTRAMIREICRRMMRAFNVFVDKKKREGGEGDE